MPKVARHTQPPPRFPAAIWPFLKVTSGTWAGTASACSQGRPSVPEAQEPDCGRAVEVGGALLSRGRIPGPLSAHSGANTQPLFPSPWGVEGLGLPLPPTWPANSPDRFDSRHPEAPSSTASPVSLLALPGRRPEGECSNPTASPAPPARAPPSQTSRPEHGAVRGPKGRPAAAPLPCQPPTRPPPR